MDVDTGLLLALLASQAVQMAQIARTQIQKCKNYNCVNSSRPTRIDVEARRDDFSG